LFDHVKIGVSDYAASRAFFPAPAGGTDNGPPGLRPQYSGAYYAAFVLGPDGHDVEAVCHEDPDPEAGGA
jgi:catechol 2,3-dioxygenase-like lactoylglutathione lyase family enzyme